jgi:PAS domain S-box-containing protein
MSLGVTVTDFDGKILYINPADARRQDATTEELLGQSAPWVFPGEDPQLTQSGVLQPWERETITEGPENLCLRVLSQTVRDESGVPFALLTLREDISRQRALESALERRDRILRAVEMAAERFLADPSWESSLPDVLSTLAEATRTHRVRLVKDLESATTAALGSLGEQFPSQSTGVGEHENWFFQPRLGPTSTGRLAQMSSGLRRALDFPDVGSYVMIPLQGLGCLCLEDPEVARFWTRPELDALRTATRMLGSAVLRRRAENLLMAREERLSTLLDTISDPIASFDSEDRFSYINRAFSNLLGYHLGNLAQRRLQDVVHEEDRDELAGLLTELRSGRWSALSDPPTLVFLSADGGEIPLACHFETQPSAEGSMKYRGIFQDRRTEQAANRVRRQFISLVHHELKTPLTSILGASRLLESEFSGVKGSDSERLFEILNRNTHRLGRLIEKLLDLQRLSLGQMHYQLEYFEVQPLLDEAVMGKSSTALRANHQVLGGLSPGIFVYADREKCLHALDELLDNACRFAWEGTEIRLELECQGNEVLIHVEDEGPGFSSGAIEDFLLGIPQVQVDTQHHSQGGGIGLTLTKELVEGMGGKLVVDSRPGEGAKVTIRLPAQPPKAVLQAMADDMGSANLEN